MAKADHVLKAQRVVLPEGTKAASVAVADGKIVSIGAFDADYGDTPVTELAEDEILLPGLVDIHVHVNEPGRTEWEGFESATKAAAASGITTLIDMPLNSIPYTTSVEALDVKRDVAKDKIRMDVGFWGGAIPGNVADLKPMWDEGVYGFKSFLGDSGLEDYPWLSPEQLVEAMEEIKSFDGLIIVHAEDAGVLDEAPGTDGRDFIAFMNSHPEEAEVVAVKNVIEAVRKTGCRTHILHLASSDALPLIAAAKAEGLPLTAETAAHYLTFDAEEIPEGATEYKCCPPLREHANRMGLWQGLRDGTIDLIASDHSPSTADLKSTDTGDFGTAWGGIASVQLGLSAVWTQARQFGDTIEDICAWMGSKPAALVGLEGKGSIAVGNAADFAIFAPEETWTVDKTKLYHKNPVTPYDGRSLYGVVRSTWLAGEPLDLEAAARGTELRRS